MPGQQKHTGVDMHGEDHSQEEKEEQKRQLEAYHRALINDAPYVAQQYDYETSANQQNVNYGIGAVFQQTTSHLDANDQGFNAHDASTSNYRSSGQYYFTATNNAAAAAAAASNAIARNHQTDMDTGNMVDIVNGKKNKREKRKQKMEKI